MRPLVNFFWRCNYINYGTFIRGLQNVQGRGDAAHQRSLTSIAIYLVSCLLYCLLPQDQDVHTPTTVHEYHYGYGM